jgi:hypothetical protein
LHQLIFLELYHIVGTGIPSATLTFQTAGESLNFNPNIHGIVSSGCFDDDNFYKLPAKELSRRY